MEYQDYYKNDDCEYNRSPVWFERKVKSSNVDPNKHYPNKNESKILRKIMSETGLTEKEVRNHKKYRIMLSKAQKIKGKKDKTDRMALSILKSVLQELKLPKEHPKVLQRLEDVLKEMRKFSYSPSLVLGLNAKKIIELKK